MARRKKVEVKKDVVCCKDCVFFTAYEDKNSKGELFWGECAITGYGMLMRWTCDDARKRQ